MSTATSFNLDLIRRYDQSGPRYTSYPPATQFSSGITATEYESWAKRTNEDPIPRSLSIYVHIPFCSMICYYCACNKVITKDRSKAVEYLSDLFHEIDLQGALFDRDRSVDQLHLGGGTPTFLELAQLESLITHIGENFHLRDDDSGEYSIEIDPRSIEVDSIERLRYMGFNRLSLGVQDFDSRVQKAVNRIQTVETTKKVLEAARKTGYRSVNMDLIYGLPQQSLRSFEKTIDIMIQLDPDRIALYNYAHLPHRFPPQRRIDENDLPAADEKLAILQYAITRLTQVGYVYIGMDHFAKPTDELTKAQSRGNLHRNFQGYSAHAECDSIALGISAIGKLGENFSQNTTDLSQYHDLLMSNRLPIQRGYRAETEDVMRAELIQQLICHFRLDIVEFEQKWDIKFHDFFDRELKQLEIMQRDKLLDISERAILVSQSGRLLIRNICMVFDQYITQAATTSTYSKLL